MRAAPQRPSLRSPETQSRASPLRHLRFSPDGRYVLAQDSSRVTVLTVQPLAVLFKIPSRSASLAEFSLDSTQVLFISSVTRLEPDRTALAGSPAYVERWSIADRKRTEFTELRSESCGTLKLSPDGRMLACVDFTGTLRFLDVGSGKPIFAKKGLCRPYQLWFPFNGDGPVPRPHNFGDPGDAGIEFSFDGRFILAAPGLADGSPFCWDAVERKHVGAGLRQQRGSRVRRGRRTGS